MASSLETISQQRNTHEVNAEVPKAPDGLGSIESCRLSFKNLSKQFGKIRALDGVTLDLAGPQVVGLLGHNGAGKSTLLNIWAGTLLPEAGEATLGNRDLLRDRTEAQRRIGFLSESNPLYPEMRAVEFLYWQADLYGLSRPEAHANIAWATKATNAQSMLKRRVGDLSRGMRQRVGLAAALLIRPDLLLLDEPSSGLDPGQRREFLRLIKKLGRERLVIHSTHLVDEVLSTCDSLIVLRQGGIEAAGTLEELAKRAVDEDKRPPSCFIAIDGPDKKELLQELYSDERLAGTRFSFNHKKDSVPGDSLSGSLSWKGSGADHVVITDVLNSLATKNGWVIREIRTKRPPLRARLAAWMGGDK